MSISKDIVWFKNELAPTLTGYQLNYRYFEKGDFGSLNQVEFNSKNIGGNIDFWGAGLVGVFVWNYETEKEVLNLLIDANQNKEIDKVFETLIRLLK